MKDFSPLSIDDAAVGFPARLCVITRTDGTVLRFAESDESFIVDGDTFVVVAGLQISAVKHTSNGETPSCQITAVHEVGGVFSTTDIDIGLFDGAAVQIYIVDRLDLSARGLLFTGAIGNTSYSVENQVVFDVKGPSVAAKILMTQQRSPMCRTDLFSTLCGLDKTAYDVATTVDALGAGSFTFTVTGSLAQADGYFNNGVLVTALGVTLVVSNWVQSTQTITCYKPCSRLLTAGEAITLYPGCDKTLTGPNGCASFGNQLNFIGEPHFLGTAAAAQQV